MFWMMKRHLAGKGGRIGLRLKSRTDTLSDTNARRLERFAAHDLTNPLAPDQAAG
jgi:hypothetical protein